MLLFVSAIAEELGDLPGEPLGVGPVVVAARMARILAEKKPTGVVLIGTAGAYAGGPEIGTPVLAQRCGLSHGVAAMGLGYVPRPPQPIAADPELAARLPDLTRANVLTVGAVTTDSLLAQRLSDGWQVEHMEAFGVATACAQAGVPFVAVLGIANLVGPDAHLEWLSNQRLAQDAAREAVRHLRAEEQG